MPHRIFNITEAAAYLHLALRELEELARHNAIPSEKQGQRVIFRKKDIDAWASQHILQLRQKSLTAYHKQTSLKTRHIAKNALIIADLARIEAVESSLKSKTKPSLLRDLTCLADQTGLVSDAKELLRSLNEREQLCSTALADGLAIPHPRHHEPYMFLESFIALARSAQPIPFGAEDGKQTDLFILICCQDDRLHLHVLARLCVIFRQTKALRQLREAGDNQAMLAVLREAEQEVIRNM